MVDIASMINQMILPFVIVFGLFFVIKYLNMKSGRQIKRKIIQAYQLGNWFIVRIRNPTDREINKMVKKKWMLSSRTSTQKGKGRRRRTTQVYTFKRHSDAVLRFGGLKIRNPFYRDKKEWRRK